MSDSHFPHMQMETEFLTSHCTCKKEYQVTVFNLSHVIRTPVYAICKQQNGRSACASAQSDQRRCCSLPR